MLWAAAIHNLQLFLCKYVFLERQKGALPHIRLRSVAGDSTDRYDNYTVIVDYFRDY